MKKTDNSNLSIAFAALGMVYGDIGTSPIYALKESFTHHHISVQPSNVFGLLSLIFWLLVFVVSIKYLTLVMRADHSGEGGTFSLMLLANEDSKVKAKLKKNFPILIILGLIGGSFFYGEVVITPAISVLSAVEGLSLITPKLDYYVIPIAICILTALFWIQRHGTQKVSNFFSPIMMIWFISLAILGVKGIIQYPHVLESLNPMWAVNFIISNKWDAFLTLSAVVLVITGAEALYADMGHFGKGPIRIAWSLIVFPSLVLNYFGQGALILKDPSSIKNPFYLLAPSWTIIPLVILSAMATVIASQAVISGVFSLSRQAIRLGYLPEMRVINTSLSFGQIYIPLINWILYIFVIALVVVFRKSSSLAEAYGIAVTGTMVITSILFAVTTYRRWKWPFLFSLMLGIFLLCIDLSLFISNILKIFSGGWLPLLLGLIMFVIMSTWKIEKSNISFLIKENSKSLNALISSLENSPPIRVLGTAIYLSREVGIIPLALLHNLKHNKVLHERVILLTLEIKDKPYVHGLKRIKIKRLSNTFWQLIAYQGFKETLDIQEVLCRSSNQGLPLQINDCSFFLSYETLIMTQRPWYLAWRGSLFIWLHRNSPRVSDQFQIPPNRVVELGTQVEF